MGGEDESTTTTNETLTLPEQTARTRQLNRQGYNRYWTSHCGKVRAIDRTYYHRKQDRIVRQQRERRAAKKSPFRKLSYNFRFFTR